MTKWEENQIADGFTGTTFGYVLQDRTVPTLVRRCVADAGGREAAVKPLARVLLLNILDKYVHIPKGDVLIWGFMHFGIHKVDWYKVARLLIRRYGKGKVRRALVPSVN